MIHVFYESKDERKVPNFGKSSPEMLKIAVWKVSTEQMSFFLLHIWKYTKLSILIAGFVPRLFDVSICSALRALFSWSPPHLSLGLCGGCTRLYRLPNIWITRWWFQSFIFTPIWAEDLEFDLGIFFRCASKHHQSWIPDLKFKIDTQN